MQGCVRVINSPRRSQSCGNRNIIGKFEGITVGDSDSLLVEVSGFDSNSRTVNFDTAGRFDAGESEGLSGNGFGVADFVIGEGVTCSCAVEVVSSLSGRKFAPTRRRFNRSGNIIGKLEGITVGDSDSLFVEVSGFDSNSRTVNFDTAGRFNAGESEGLSGNGFGVADFVIGEGVTGGRAVVCQVNLLPSVRR